MPNTHSCASRRDFLTGLAGTSLAVAGGLTATSASAAPGFGRGPRSGMPWHSGASLVQIQQFEAYRGRRADVITSWQTANSWSDVARLSPGFGSVVRTGSRMSTAIAPLPKAASIYRNCDSFKLAASGKFDTYYTAFARALASSGTRDPIVRVGWECNDDRAWFCGIDPDGFKATFGRIARILRQSNPSVSIEWSNVRRGVQKMPITDCYPGDDVVDIIGVNYYDRYPAFNSQAIWNGFHYRSDRGAPWGLGSWLQFAKSRGKRVSISEWGVAAGAGPGSQDNPLYIELMHDFFREAGSYLAYENYFNQQRSHQLTPANTNPKASAKYKQLWS